MGLDTNADGRGQGPAWTLTLTKGCQCENAVRKMLLDSFHNVQVSPCPGKVEPCLELRKSGVGHVLTIM